MKKQSIDLAGKSYWDSVYTNLNSFNYTDAWTPKSYSEKLIAFKLDEAIVKLKPKSILEIGCGNSFWLIYINKKYGVKVAGLDYSEKGCELARVRLSSANVDANIFCEDFFIENIEIVGKYDLVFSLGVAEHFDDTAGAIENLMKYVNTNGFLFTEIPNFHYSIYYFICKIWQPKQLEKHKIFGLYKLQSIYNKLGFVDLTGSYLGLFSLDVIAWGSEARFPKLEKRLIYRIKKISRKLDNWNVSMNFYNSKISFFSPFFFVLGRKKCVE